MAAHPSNNFDAIRLAGALMVLISHQFALSGRPEPHIAGDVSLGALGVLIFFSISGHLVAISWRNDPAWGRFAARRLLRIWPGLAASVVVTISLAWLFGGRMIGSRFLANLVFVSADGPFFPTNPLVKMNGSLWTIQLEVLCYVAFAGVGLLFGRNLARALVIIGGLIAPAYLLLAGSLLDAGAIHAGIRLLPYFATFFFAGALQAVFRVPSVVAVAMIVLGPIFIGLGHVALGLWMVVPLIAIAVGRSSWPILDRAGRFGDLSYGIYLWAWPVQQVGVLLLGQETGYPVLLATSLLVVVPLAFASWHLVERRALSFKPTRSLSRAADRRPVSA